MRSLLIALIAAPCASAQVGPDVYVGDLWNITRYTPVGPITAFAVGTTACNAGDAPVGWYSQTNQHPVIAQNMYRLMSGRFEQLGQSWAKHGFGSENGTFCSACTYPPGGFSQLGVGCSDAYDAGTNGLQGLLGPRSQVSATTGDFPYPFSGPGYSTTIDRRLQVFTSDIDPALNPGALYFVEGHYLTADDARANNGLNNATYRQVTIASPTATPTLFGAAHLRQPAISAWADTDPSVALTPADYSDGALTARFWVAAKASDNGDGTWHYEFAVHNLNAARNAGSFSIPLPAGITPINPGFHAPFSHSGEPFDNTPWSVSIEPAAVTWSTTPFSTDPNANAIRWGTLYNFRFDAAAAPTTGAANLGLHSPGAPASLAIPGLPIPGAPCYANCDHSTVPPVLNINDFSCFINRFAAGTDYANCDRSTMPPVLNVLDFTCFLNAFAAGCT
jgi:hypothetical protein